MKDTLSGLMDEVEGIQWFAKGGQIAKMGPYETQELAAAALITVDGLPIEGAYVWPETKAMTKKYAQLAKAASTSRRGARRR